MKIYILKLLVSVFSVFYISCSGDRPKNTEETDSLKYYKMAYEYIKESKEFDKYSNKYRLSNLKEHLCISSGILHPTRLYFVTDYINYSFQNSSDSVRRIKRDSILLLPNEEGHGRQVKENISIGDLAPKEDCKLQLFFSQFKENYLMVSVHVVEKHEADFFSFDHVVNTSLSYFFIFENERIVKVFVEEVTS